MKLHIARYTRILFCLFSLNGIVVTVARMDRILSGLSYYTIQSNILCLIVMIFVLVRGWNGKPMGRTLSIFKTGSAVAILITFLVFHFILRPGMTTEPWSDFLDRFENTVVHYICPLWFLADFLVFDPKGQIQKFDPFWWSLVPIAYLAYANVYALLGGVFQAGNEITRYPYFFIDPDIIGWANVLGWVGIVLILFLVLSYGLFGIDRLFVHFQSKNARKAGNGSD
jgi:hypothetical protein